LENKNKKLFSLQETFRFKETELEKKESMLTRLNQTADETKKKLL